MTIDQELLLMSSVPYVETPLIYSKALSNQAPCKIYLKQEFVQPSGSYKLRGLSHHIKTKLNELRSNNRDIDRIKVVAASGGNAGNAVSYAANFYNLESIIVVPESTSSTMKQKIQLNGSAVIVQGKNIGEADDYTTRRLIPKLESEGFIPIYCHPYNLPDIWDGHSSIIDEVASQLAKSNQLHRLKAIVCSIGGGGLYNGIVNGLKRNKLSQVPILTLETDSCPTFQEAIIAKKSVQIKSFNTIATSLACPYISPQSLENYNSHKTLNALVSDSNAAASCLRFANDMNTIVEPACGVALCSVYNDVLAQNADFFGGFEKEDIVVVIVCGGSGTSIEDLSRYKQIYQL